MKKTRLLLAVLAGVLLLTACGGSGPGGVEDYHYDAGDLQAMADAGAFSESLETVDADTAFLLYRLADYGVEREDVTECVVIRSAGATCEEGAVFRYTAMDQEHIDQVRQALEDYIQGQIASNRDYRPAEIPKLEKALIGYRNGTFLLVVANDLDAAKKVLNEAGKS